MTDKTRTVTLTGRPPVKIVADNWPVIAHGSYERYEGQHKCQSNRTTEIDIRVRQHADGRALVYGVYSYETRFQGERCKVQRCGYLLPLDAADTDAVITAIRRCGEDLIEREVDPSAVRDTVNGCIADLPPEELA